MPLTRRRITAAATVLVMSALTLSTTSSAALADPASANRPEVKALPSSLETVRAQEAKELYGETAVKPLEERKSSLVTMGDSEISGEGVGNYDPNTHRDGNWCDRSYDQAVFRTGIKSDVQYNVACSGAASPNLIQSTGETQWDEMNQGDNLAIKARNTHIKLVWITVGANDTNGIEFGPVATDCVKNRVLFKGSCYEEYTDEWTAKVQVSRDGVANSIDGIRQTMTDAGYLNSDYEFVVMSYPSPLSPDVQDNPDFPGWYDGGCLMYLADLAFTRNKAVPLFEQGVREAATSAGARYLNAGRLFDGHAVCSDNTWARGLYIETGELPSEHAFRQSLHPNARGHGAFAQCVTQFYQNPGWKNATCVDPASTGNASLYEGLFEFKDLKATESRLCVDAKGYDSRIGTPLQSHDCHGGRNQGFYFDQSLGSLHVELSHDRCVDSGDGSMGSAVTLGDCDGGTNQRFVLDDSGIHPSGATDRCVAFAAAEADSQMVIGDCGTAEAKIAPAAREYDNPVGYGHDDFIGDSVY